MPASMEERVLAGMMARETAGKIQPPEGCDAEHFWFTLASAAAAKCGHVLTPDGPASAAMPDAEAARFERERLPWGVYAGQEVGGVPADYLAAIIGSTLNKKLGRYVKSERFKRRQLEEDS